MKQLWLFLLVALLPINLLAAGRDHCTNPSEYTIDRRCYVTEQQKKEKPYSAVVALLDNNSVYCTGTIVKGDNGKFYLYTAAHCVRDEKYNYVSSVNVRLIDGTIKTANFISAGEKKANSTGRVELISDKFSLIDGEDWAVFSFNNTNMPFVKLSLDPKNENALSLGYGALKIMSDNEITYLKNAYIDFLKNNKYPDISYDKEQGVHIDHDGNIVEVTNKYGFSYDGGIYISSTTLNSFISDINFDNNFCKDNNLLKVSHCQYDFDYNYAEGCQGWGGNSGGGLFDSDGNIMAITSGAHVGDMIGGSNHAIITEYVGVPDIPDKTE